MLLSETIDPILYRHHKDVNDAIQVVRDGVFHFY